LLTVINEESDRLNRLVGEAAEVAQLDSHQLELHFELHSIHEPIDTALQAARQNLQRHPVDVKIPEKVPNIKMDADRISEFSGETAVG
jgi:two-component system, OmpR family, sensor histidine kinase KdpD